MPGHPRPHIATGQTMPDHAVCHRDIDRLLTHLGDLEDVIGRALGALNSVPKRYQTTEFLYARSILADALVYRIERTHIDGSGCAP